MKKPLDRCDTIKGLIYGACLLPDSNATGEERWSNDSYCPAVTASRMSSMKNEVTSTL
jgi:hypothetical protein